MFTKILFFSIVFYVFTLYGSHDQVNFPQPPKFECHQQEDQVVDPEHHETRITYKKMSLAEIEAVTAQYHRNYLRYLLCALVWKRDHNEELQISKSFGVLSFQPLKMKKISQRLISLISIEYDTAFCSDPDYENYVARETERKAARDALYADVLGLS